MGRRRAKVTQLLEAGQAQVKSLSEDEKLSLFRLADVFRYPTFHEAYGIVFLEAMSQRTPIISYAESAMPEVIGKGGVLAPLDDRRRMTELLDLLVDSPQQRSRLGNNGYALCTSRNDPQRIAREYEAVFEEALS